ncbi:MAG: PfkB family carbohydrate kinase [Chloroflexota bacterium]|nr:PfkB family carbohydrate kinase [Chloroflexota bacterium]
MTEPPSRRPAVRPATPQPAPRVPEPVTPRQPLAAGHTFTAIQSHRTPQYLVIGHITADLQPDGRVVLGGTALYSALTAVKLGWRTAILTRGVFGRTVAGMDVPGLDAYAGDLSIICQEAEVPTTFVNEYQADRRVQTIRHWAGEIDLRGLPPHWRNARIVHLGPIAQEIDQRQTGALTPEFLGATPQGWMREWPREGGGKVRHVALRLAPSLLGRMDGLVVSVEEISQSRDAVERVGRHRLSAITQGPGGARILHGGQQTDLPGFNVKTVDLTGAGDVFATAFFIRAASQDGAAVTAGRFANAVAGLSLRSVGSDGIPTMAEVEALLAANPDPALSR